MRLETFVFSHAQSYPDKEALVQGDRRISFAHLRERVQAVANGLGQRGIRSGDRVILYMSNRIEFVEAFFGCLACGAIAVPVSTRLTIREISYFQTDSDARLIICDAPQAAMVRDEIMPQVSQLECIATGGPVDGVEDFKALYGDPSVPLARVDSSQDEALILYTSGTTGAPKGVVLTHANMLLCHGFMNAIDWGINREDRYLVVAAMAHRAGMGRMLNAMLLGGTLHILPGFDADAMIETISRERITVLGLVPTMCRMLMPALEAAPERAASIRRLAVTGEAFPVPLKQKMMSLLPDMQIMSFFGMTEAGGVTTLAHHEQFTHADSVGRASPGIEIRIVDEDCKDVPTGEVGEMLVRSDAPGSFTVMKGYFNRPEQTAESFRNGWFKTGDMARRDADGYLYIVDRKKDMIVSGGLNIYSKEVEQAIEGLPGVREVAVIGVPDEKFGECVAAVIECDPDIAVASPEEIITHCRTAIASYKKPQHVFYRSELPRNATGKVVKPALLELVLAEMVAEEEAVS